jgi:beta-phosphoglucomutase-like phosphatase (HAD superfamily)
MALHMRRPTAVLLDIDGTLVDSNDAHAAAWVAAFAEHGVMVSPRAVRDAIGKGGDKLLPDLTGVADESPLGRAIKEARARIFARDHLPGLKPFPCARELVARFAADHLRVAVATSASRDEVGALLEIAGVPHLVDGAASADDVDRSKPDPDVLGVCLARLGVVADEALLLGDTPYDVEAGRRAGVGVVGVESGGWSAGDLSPAIAVYRDVAELLAGFEASPFVSPRGIEGPR